MRTSQPQNVLRSPEPTQSIRPSSIDRNAGRSIVSTNPVELPYVDPQARYSISYVPGMSEHVVNTGKTLPEAQLKVVLLACEVERLNTLNYNLVKENEILKVQAKKSDRESDLETKLAIVLAENEKLNQIVEELHTVYARERESLTHEEYERRIAELLQDLEGWKQRYSKLEGAKIGNAEAKAIIDQLEREKENLNEQLGRQGRDLEALRAHISSIKVGGNADASALQGELANLKIQNDTLRRELEAIKLQSGVNNADALQQRLNQYDAKLRVLLTENDNLNNLLADKARNTREIEVSRQSNTEVVKNTAQGGADLSQYKSVVERLTRDNEELKTLLSQSQSASAAVADLREKINRLVAENDRLNSLVLELRSENERQRGGNNRLDLLTTQINGLLDENRKLNEALETRLKEVDTLRLRIRELEANSAASRDSLNKIAVLTSENERLNGLLIQSRAESEGLKRSTVDINKIQQLTVQINGLLDENKRLNDLLNDKAAEVERLRRQGGDTTRIESLTVQVSNLVSENSKLNQLVADRNADIDRLRRRIVELEGSSSGLDDLRGKVSSLLSENDRLNALIVQLRSENDALRRTSGDSARLAQLSTQINSLLDENTRLNTLVNERNAEIDRLRLGSAGSAELRDKLVFISSENERLNLVIVNLKSDIERLQRQGGDSSVTIKLEQLNVQVTSLLDENRRLNDSLRQRQAEVDDLRRRLTIAESTTTINTVNIDLKSQYDRLVLDNARLAKEVEDANRRVLVSSHHSIDQTSSAQIRDLEERLRLVTSERDRANAQYLDRLREVDSLKTRISQLEVSGGASSSELNVRITSLTREIEVLRQTLAGKDAELDQLRKRPIDQTGDRQRVDILLAENEQLNGLLSGKVREADLLRGRISDLERELGTEREKWNILLLEKQREIDAVKLQSGREFDSHVLIDTQTETVKNTALRNSTIVRHEDAIRSLNGRIAFLDEEVKRLTEVLLERDREAAELKAKISENEFARQESSRLSLLISEKQREIEELRKNAQGTITEIEYQRLLNTQVSELTIRFNQERQELTAKLEDALEKARVVSADYDRLAIQNNDHLQEIENWRRKHDQLDKQRLAEYDILKQDYEKRVRESPIKKSQFLKTTAELQTANDELHAEIEKLQDHLNLALGEVEDLRTKLRNAESTKTRELDELRRQFDESRRANIEVKEVHIKFAAERVAYETQIHQLQQKIADLETQVGILSNESNRFGKLSTSRLEEAQDFRKKYNDLKAEQNSEIVALKSQIESYKARGQEVKQLAIKYSADKAADQAQIKQLKQVIENYKAEIEKLHELVEQSKTEFVRLTQVNEQLSLDVQSLHRQQSSSESSSVAHRVEQLERELTETKQISEQYQQQATRNSVDLTRRNKELVDKLQDLDVLKLKYEEALANYQALNTRLFTKLSTA